VLTHTPPKSIHPSITEPSHRQCLYSYNGNASGLQPLGKFASQTKVSNGIFLQRHLHFVHAKRPRIWVRFKLLHLRSGLGLTSSPSRQPGLPYEHQEITLETIVALCQEPSFVVDVYIAYDCDVHFGNLFEKLIDFLYRVRTLSRHWCTARPI